MTYCISDIHGESDRYFQMLDEINLTDNDTLYVIGDVLDREGDGGIDILQDIMGRKNIKLLLGNHEEIALEGMELLMTEKLGYETIQASFSEWINLGGMCTIDAFNALSRDNKQRIVKFLQQTLTYAEISIGETDYVLTHDESYYDDPYGAILITGHTPTRYYDENPNPDFIWRDGDHYHIDCGCGYGGQLGALCLEMDAEFYV